MLTLQPPTFLRPFLKLTIISILSNLLVLIAGLLDMAFLGHLAEIRHQAGVAIATVLFNGCVAKNQKHTISSSSKSKIFLMSCYM